MLCSELPAERTQGAGGPCRPCCRGAPRNWTIADFHLLDGTERENRAQPSRGENEYLWEKILVAAVSWTASIFVWTSYDFSLTSARPCVSCIHFSESFPHLSLDLRWCQNNFRSVSLQVSGLALSRPCITIIWWLITRITSISIAASSEKRLIEYYEFSNILYISEFSCPEESGISVFEIERNRRMDGWGSIPVF